MATALIEHSRNRRFGRDNVRQIIEKDNSLCIMARNRTQEKSQGGHCEKMSENRNISLRALMPLNPSLSWPLKTTFQFRFTVRSMKSCSTKKIPLS